MPSPKPHAVVTETSLEKRLSNSSHDTVKGLTKTKSLVECHATPIDSSSDDETAAEAAVVEEDHEYPSPARLSVIVIALCLTVFCMALDNTIIATAIPRITSEFSSVVDIGWYGSAYLLTTCSFQLIFGRLYMEYAPKHIFLLTISLFELGSLICGVAPNSACFIIGRSIAGIGAAGIFSGSLLIIKNSVSLRRRSLYISAISSMYGIACIAGPLIGGAFTDHLTWRWCFYINFPFGFISFLFIAICLRLPVSAKSKSTLSLKEKFQSFDLAGTFCFIPSMVALFLALQWGGTQYSWSDGRIIALFVVFVLLLISFLFIQIRLQERATIPPRILLHRTVWSCALFGACLGAAFFIMVYYLPMWFQAVEGATAVESGLRNLPMVLSVTTFSLVAGILVTVFGYYAPFMIISSILMSVGAGMLSTLSLQTSSTLRITYQIIFGAGVGLGLQQTVVAVQATLDSADIPIGTAIIIFFQTLGGSIFIYVAENVFENSLLAEVPHFDSTDHIALLHAMSISQVKEKVPPRYLPMIFRFYNDSITNTYYISAALAALSLLGAVMVPWHSVKGRNVGLGKL